MLFRSINEVNKKKIKKGEHNRVYTKFESDCLLPKIYFEKLPVKLTERDRDLAKMPMNYEEFKVY